MLLSIFPTSEMELSGENTIALAICNHKLISLYSLVELVYFLIIFLTNFCFLSAFSVKKTMISIIQNSICFPESRNHSDAYFACNSVFCYIWLDCFHI